MDRATRNEIAGATQRARRLLEEEISSQLEGTFDILPTAAIAERGGRHLSEYQQFEREKIAAAINHKRATGMPPAAAVADYIRDTAFTILNRFVALKMLEARHLVQECISKGEESSGYKEFYGMAPGLPLLPDSAGYQFYLESLFDELSTEVKVLFDRRDLTSIIWPRRTAFEALLSVLDAPELAGIWAEDETLAWVYQYFNSPEERRALREASQAPRNSRELAIRNQFFTPRYVVQFLTDNTLGRIWYEMHGGETKLVEHCEYLVRRPAEAWEPRAKKDPRDLKILDPACGSGHFLLYSFDLLLLIYEEGWADPHAPLSEATGRTLRQDYPNLESLRTGLPRLILRHNLHGIDIDPRCAQIAQLSLWMRAQRAFRNYGISGSDRPIIRRANIVIAEPMPGERDLLDEFLRGLKEDRLEGLLRRALDLPADRTVRATKAMADSLAELVTAVWHSMRLAGEMGSLLKIDRALKNAIEKGRAEWEDRLPLFRVAEYGLDQGRAAPVKETLVRAVPGEQEDFWSKAEKLVFQALADYADTANALDATRRRLFAEDAAQGFAFADLATNRFDVVLMNPPFGKSSIKSQDYYNVTYSEFKIDIGIAFVDRCLGFLCENGSLGAITSRTYLASDSLVNWRGSRLLSDNPIYALLDLGYGVLDDAMVEAACLIADADRHDRNQRVFIRALEARDKEAAVRGYFEEESRLPGLLVFTHDLDEFQKVPLRVICYWLPKGMLQKIVGLSALVATGGAARHGLVTTDDFRFLRLAWETSEFNRGRGRRWCLMAKGGEYQPYWDDLHLLVDWFKDGAYLKTFLAAKRLATQGSPDWSPWLNHHQFYFLEGLTYPERTTSDFSARCLPRDVIFSSTGQAIQFDDPHKTIAYLGGCFTRFFKLVIESFVGSGDNAFPGSAAKHYRSGLLNQLTAPLVTLSEDAEADVRGLIEYFWNPFRGDETSRHFVCVVIGSSICSTAKQLMQVQPEGAVRVRLTDRGIERACVPLSGLDQLRGWLCFWPLGHSHRFGSNPRARSRRPICSHPRLPTRNADWSQ